MEDSGDAQPSSFCRSQSSKTCSCHNADEKWGDSAKIPSDLKTMKKNRQASTGQKKNL
jgi:hypothetical protein